MKRSKCGFDTAVVLLVLTAACIVTQVPALADPQPCNIPDHVKARLELVCREATAEGRLAPLEKLDFDSIMKLMEQNKCAKVRFCALYSIGEIKDGRATEALLTMLKDGNPNVRRIAAHSLGKIRDERAVMPLIEVLCLENEPKPVTCAAAQALGKLGDPRATRILSYLTSQEGGWVKREASRALERIRSVEGS